jgi:hypothetical protein
MEEERDSISNIDYIHLLRHMCGGAKFALVLSLVFFCEAFIQFLSTPSSRQFQFPRLIPRVFGPHSRLPYGLAAHALSTGLRIFGSVCRRQSSKGGAQSPNPVPRI